MKKKILLLAAIAALSIVIACFTVACGGNTAVSGGRERMTVTFYTGADETLPAITAEYGKPYGALPEPTRKFYEFEGWEYRPHGGAEAEIITSESAVKEVRDHTLYATWKFVGTSENADRYSVGNSHCLRIDDDGNIWSWGLNCYGEIGDGTDKSRIQPVKLDTEKKFKKVFATDDNSYAIDVDGGLWSWGKGGMVGDGTGKSRLSPVQIAPGIKFADITTSPYCCYAIDMDNNLWAWGTVLEYNERKGKTDEVRASAPRFMLDGIKKVAAGSDHVLALTTDDKLIVWGKNDKGHLGLGHKQDSPPVYLDDKRYVDISVSGSTSAAIDGDGKVWAWGYNGYGQAGCGKSDVIIEPTDVLNVPACAKVEITSTSGYAIDTENRLWAWGRNNAGQLGDNITEKEDVLPTLSMPDMRVSSICTSGDSIMAQDTEGILRGWGRNKGGVIDPVAMQANITPTKIESDVKFAKLFAGDDHTAAIDENGDLWCWGRNFAGQLGDGTYEDRYQPIKLDIRAKFEDVSIGWGDWFVVALDINGNIWTWGDGSYGQLGDGEKYTMWKGRSIPKQITTGVQYTQIHAGHNCAFALDRDGNVWTWGNNGQFFSEGVYSSNKPVKVLENTDYARILGSYDDLLAVDADGRIWSYEDKKYGEAPEDISARYGFNKIFSTKGGSYFAYDGDGELWGWGDNMGYQIQEFRGMDGFQNTTLGIPTVVYDYSKYGVLKSVACDGGTVLAIDGDGDLCSWGKIGVGKTGTGKVYTSYLGGIGYQAPQPFEKIDTGGIKFVQADVGMNFGVALDEEGNVWSWGARYLGRGKKDGYVGLMRITVGEVP